MTAVGVTYPISGGAAGVPFEDVILEPPAASGFTRWQAAVVSNYSGGIGTIIGADDDLTNTPALTPFTADVYRFTNVRGPLVVHWLNTGLTPPGGAAIVVTFSDDPNFDLAGKVYPTALPVANLSVTPPPSGAPTLSEAPAGITVSHSGTTLTEAYDNVSAGALLVLCIVESGTTLTGIGSADGAWTKIAGFAGSGCSFWYLVATTGGAPYDYTMSFSGSETLAWVTFNVTNYSGTPTANPYADGTGSPAGQSSVTIASDAMVIAFLGTMPSPGDSASVTPPSGFTTATAGTVTGVPVYAFCGSISNTGSTVSMDTRWTADSPPQPFESTWFNQSVTIDGA